MLKFEIVSVFCSESFLSTRVKFGIVLAVSTSTVISSSKFELTQKGIILSLLLLRASVPSFEFILCTCHDVA